VSSAARQTDTYRQRALQPSGWRKGDLLNYIIRVETLWFSHGPGTQSSALGISSVSAYCK